MWGGCGEYVWGKREGYGWEGVLWGKFVLVYLLGEEGYGEEKERRGERFNQ